MVGADSAFRRPDGFRGTYLKDYPEIAEKEYLTPVGRYAGGRRGGACGRAARTAACTWTASRNPSPPCDGCTSAMPSC